jgi:hypothetical protein
VETEEITIIKQWLCKHVLITMDMHAALEELLEFEFYMFAMPKVCSDDQQD